MSKTQTLFTAFNANVNDIEIPQRFTYPFSYTPHPLAKLAAQELQQRLNAKADWQHQFGINNPQHPSALGKMFGVLVVQNQAGELGYLSAYSGKLQHDEKPQGFAPPVYELPKGQNYFLDGLADIEALSHQLKQLQESPEFLNAKARANQIKAAAKNELDGFRTEMKAAKKKRQADRKEAEKRLSLENQNQLKAKHQKESLHYRSRYRRLKIEVEQTIEEGTLEHTRLNQKIETLKAQRRQTSAALQDQLFTNFTFLNSAGKSKSLLDIFKTEAIGQPPAGAGECAAPRLLQAAFIQKLKPVAMAEFWWGKSPKSEVRKHGYFYPACKGKCQPILGHMLHGIPTDTNPMLVNIGQGKFIETVYEDNHLLVINKPDGLLSIPGKDIADSVATRMKKKYPEATGPLIVHRLDQHTSGLLLVAKTKDVHKHLQEQFQLRIIKKRYVALLDGLIEKETGVINLPLCVDYNNRPLQMVSHEHGKRAITRFKVVDVADGKTRIHLYPITGRSHQLRVHMAHQDGLNTPIVGDDLYGLRANRLHLHAEFLEFVHPATEKKIRINAKAGF